MIAASALTAKWRARLLTPGADWLNPIVVKELRQAVQSRFVLTALMVLLSIQLAALAIYLLASGDLLLSLDAGRQVFLVLFAIWLGVSLLFVPLYSAVRLAAERADTNVDLLFITTINPRRIIMGKLLAAVVLIVLVFSACLPFLTLTYFLRGIDLPAIFVALGLGFTVVVFCTQAAIFVACLPVNRGLKALIGVNVLIVFVVIYSLTLGMASELVQQGVSVLWRVFQVTLGLMTLTGVFLWGLFFTLAVALIMPLAANRALPVRAFITAAWLLIGVGLGAWSIWAAVAEPAQMWLTLFGSLFGIALFVAISERDFPGRRVLRAVPHVGWRRSIAFFFFSGAANSLAWACVSFVLTVGATCGMAWLLWKFRPSNVSESMFSYRPAAVLLDAVKWLSGMFLYFFCYALSAALLRRWLFKRMEAKLTWLLSVVLLMLGSIVPFLIGALFVFGNQPWSEQAGAWLVGNPFAWSVVGQRRLYAAVGVVWALLVAAFSLPWFVARLRSFRPPATRDITTDEHG